MGNGTKRFFEEDLWEDPPVPGARSRIKHIARALVLAVKGFAQDLCPLRASALTVYTLLSIVPFIALLLGIAQGLGLETTVEKYVRSSLTWQKEVTDSLIDFARNLLLTSRGGVVAGAGVAVLLWVVVNLLGTIESSFNAIWKVPRPRTMFSKFTDYLAMIVIGTVLLALSNSLSVVVARRILGQSGEEVFLLRFFSLAVNWLLFAFIYMFMPNTKVSLRAGILGGLFTGTLYNLLQWVYLRFQIGLSYYSAVYGSLAAVPLFIVWLQTSWGLVLFGCELSVASENVRTYGYRPDQENLNHRLFLYLAVRTQRSIVKTFAVSARPLSDLELSRQMAVPLRLVRHILNELERASLVSRVFVDGSAAFQPLGPPESFTVASVVDALELAGPGVFRPLSKQDNEIIAAIQDMAETALRSRANARLVDL